MGGLDSEELVRRASELARTALGESFDHGYGHVLRVESWARRIVEAERLDVDWLVLRLSIYLHDVGRPLGEPHALYSAIVARGFLESAGLEGSRLERVVNAILYHSYSYARSAGVRPMGPEAMVLSDADKLDALGLVGFLRVMSYGWRAGRSLEESLRHFDEKILRLKDLMHFGYSRREAERLTARVRELLDALAEELGLSRSPG
ncbi:MAG: HD domain-containing protein [Desulfurococcaceae archaeon]